VPRPKSTAPHLRRSLASAQPARALTPGERVLARTVHKNLSANRPGLSVAFVENNMRKHGLNHTYASAVASVRKSLPRASPESRFIRSGRIPKRFDQARAQKIGERFLSRTWVQEHRVKREEPNTDPLPRSRRARIEGVRLPKKDIEPILVQARFAVETFLSQLPSDQRTKALAKVFDLVRSENLNVRGALEEYSTTDAKKMRKAGTEFYENLNETGSTYQGMMSDETGKSHLRLGWSKDKLVYATPIHEVIHVLQKLKYVKVDVPFAYSIDRLYALEKRKVLVKGAVADPRGNEFDRMPIVLNREKSGRIEYEEEAEWVEPLGTKIGEWVFKNLKGSDRWEYMRLRCDGKTHAGALAMIRGQPRRKAA